MRERLLIVGAGGFGREVLSWVLHIPRSQRPWDFAGFIDDRINALDGMNMPAVVLGTPMDYSFGLADRVVVAIGQPEIKQMMVARLIERNVKFISVIHPSVIIGLNNIWGDGCIFCPGVILTTNVKVGKHVIFNCRSGAGHDAVIGDYCTLSGFVDVTGYAKIGNGVFLGSHASVLPQTQIGDGAIIGAGSVAVNKILPNTTVIGIPAREIWKRSSI